MRDLAAQRGGAAQCFLRIGGEGDAAEEIYRGQDVCDSAGRAVDAWAWAREIRACPRALSIHS
jgi:hypothetical protein